MYVTTRFADTPQVHHVALPGAARRQLTFQPERVLSARARPGHGQFLMAMDEGGAENYQLFLHDRTGGEPRRITDGKSRNIGPRWSPSGELLAWSGNARNGRDMDLYLAAPADPHFKRVLKEVSGQWTVADWSPDESKVVAEEYLSIQESYIHVIDVAHRPGHDHHPPPHRPECRALVRLRSPLVQGRQVDLLHHRQGERVPPPGAARPGHGGHEVAHRRDPLGRRGVRPERRRDPRRAGGQRGRPRRPPRVPGRDLAGVPGPEAAPGQISGLKFRAGSHEIGFTRGTAQDASDAYSLDLDQDHLERWTESETGGLDTSTFPEPTIVRYPTFDDQKIPALVYRPAAGRFPGRRPVLIEIHGGPEGQARPGFLGRLNYLVSELGIVLIMPNVRGSSGYGKTYLKLDNGVLREGAVKDIGSLLDWIARQPDLDKDRVAVSGGSYGGFMSLAVQTTYNDRIKAGIDVVGISNFVTFLKNTQAYRRDLRRAEYGDERDPKVREFLERISPLASAGKIHTPILVVQGQNDPRVPLSESEQVVSAVKKNGVPVWYVVGKNEGHGFARKSNQDYLQAVEVLFLRRYLLGEPG